MSDKQGALFSRNRRGVLWTCNPEIREMVRQVILTWYGSIRVASDRHGWKSRQTWYEIRRGPLPLALVRSIVANAEKWSAEKREKVELRYRRECARLVLADQHVETLR